MAHPDPERVISRMDLAAFARHLAEEARRGDAGWDNDRLDLFFDALAAWVTDMDGWFSNRGEPIPEQPDWQLVARMLTAATIYE